MYQAIRSLSKKTVSWAAQAELEEEQELARQRADRQSAGKRSAPPLAGEELVAGVDYNDESHDVEVGSDRDLSDGKGTFTDLRLRTSRSCGRCEPCGGRMQVIIYAKSL